jgi:dienelactone hydrolase
MSSAQHNLDRYLDDNYQHTGHFERTSDGVDFYADGTIENKKGIIIIPDLFGWNTGRTRNFADYMGDNGYWVVVPRLLARGGPSASTGSSSSQHDEDESKQFSFSFVK